MFRNIVVSVLFVVFILFFPKDAFACEPCPEILDAQEAVNQADLVIVGRRTDFNPREEQPEGIEVQVMRVFKGKIDKYSVISVKTMYGMCDYGIMMRDETALIFLKKLRRPKREWQAIIPHRFDYTSVSYGCAPKAIPIKEGMVSIEDKVISLDKLEEGKILKWPPKEDEYIGEVYGDDIENDSGNENVETPVEDDL